MNETPGFDVKKFRLKALPCDIWEGFVYVSLDANASPLAESLTGMSQLVSDFRMGGYVSVFEQVLHFNNIVPLSKPNLLEVHMQTCLPM